ncbi:MAG: DUF4397 domain-containing protein [Gemmatimonadaceae bacterium]
MTARLLAALSVAAVAACGTEDVGLTGYEPTQPTGRIRFVHAASGVGNVNVTVDGVPLRANVGYAAAAPVSFYYPAYAGERVFAVRRTADTSVHVLDAPIAVAADVDHTVIGLGGAAPTFVLTDDNAAPAAGNIKVRAVNAAPAAGTVDVYVTAQGASIATIPPTFSGLAPRTASGYVERPAGAFRVRFTTAGTKTVVRDVSVASVATGGIRTIVLLEAASGGTPLTSATLTDR